MSLLVQESINVSNNNPEEQQVVEEAQEMKVEEEQLPVFEEQQDEDDELESDDIESVGEESASDSEIRETLHATQFHDLKQVPLSAQVSEEVDDDQQEEYHTPRTSSQYAANNNNSNGSQEEQEISESLMKEEPHDSQEENLEQLDKELLFTTPKKAKPTTHELFSEKEDDVVEVKAEPVVVVLNDKDVEDFEEEEEIEKFQEQILIALSPESSSNVNPIEMIDVFSSMVQAEVRYSQQQCGDEVVAEPCHINEDQQPLPTQDDRAYLHSPYIAAKEEELQAQPTMVYNPPESQSSHRNYLLLSSGNKQQSDFKHGSGFGVQKESARDSITTHQPFNQIQQCGPQKDDRESNIVLNPTGGRPSQVTQMQKSSGAKPVDYFERNRMPSNISCSQNSKMPTSSYMPNQRTATGTHAGVPQTHAAYTTANNKYSKSNAVYQISKANKRGPYYRAGFSSASRGAIFQKHRSSMQRPSNSPAVHSQARPVPGCGNAMATAYPKQASTVGNLQKKRTLSQAFPNGVQENCTNQIKKMRKLENPKPTQQSTHQVEINLFALNEEKQQKGPTPAIAPANPMASALDTK